MALLGSVFPERELGGSQRKQMNQNSNYARRGTCVRPLHGRLEIIVASDFKCDIWRHKGSLFDEVRCRDR